MIETLCLMVVCTMPALFLVAGGALAVGYGASLVFGSREDEGWEDFERGSNWERR